jgi:hypothetical protein
LVTDYATPETPDVPNQLYPVLAGLAYQQPLLIPRNSTVNLREAILRRVFYHKVEGPWELVPRPRASVYSELTLLTDRMLFDPVPPLTYDEFLRRCPSSKRTLYANVVEDLKVNPWIIKDSIIGPFTKVEKTLKEKFDPRVIQARPPRHHAEFGRYILALEHTVYREIDRLFPGDHTIMKGRNAMKVAETFDSAWAEFEDPRAIMMDASRFDQHVSVAAMKWKHEVYRRCLRLDPTEAALFEQLVQCQYKTLGRTKELSYWVKGGLCSGDYDTSLTGCLIVCAIFYEILEGQFKYRFIDNGDDCVVILESREVERFTKVLEETTRRFGFYYRVEAVVDKLEEIKFCQCHPVLNSAGQRIMTRDPRAVLTKDLVICKPGLGFVGEARIYRAIADGGLALYGDMPVLGKLYEGLRSHYSKFKPAKGDSLSYNMLQLAKGVKVKRRQPTAESRESFYHAFGLTPARQLEIEERLGQPFQGDIPLDCEWPGLFYEL